ncbi:MAG: helix-hairpin-helix domain-containing protein [Bacteroidales bacterium]|nr:helix-hairpin-helix domain-containing protein [Bacteroidales bacterium]
MDRKKAVPKKSFIIGAIALLFLIIGYETALFIHRAAVERIVSLKERPDTVYVYIRGGEEICSHSLGMTEREAGMTEGEEIRSHSLGMTEGEEIRSHSLGMTEREAGMTEREAGMTERRRAERSGVAEKVLEQYSPRRVESFRFNPNTVSVEDLQRLGFSEKQAASIDNYRQKGGVFRRKEDFAKSYVVADSVYQRLAPYISIPKLDINKADSAAFTTLPGIGKYFAVKMVEYRTRLGGYTYPEQLMEIYRFDREKYDGLKDLITCSAPKPYPIWTLPEDELAKHPYIGRAAARAIVLYRNNTPPEQRSAEGIIKAGIIPEEYAGRFLRCFNTTCQPDTDPSPQE